MSNLNRILGVCACCLCLTVGNTALADYTGVVHVVKADDDTVDLCTNANGPNVPEPVDVCNVLAGFDNPEDRLLSVGNSEIAASNNLFYQHPNNFDPTPISCGFVAIIPDLICDSFVTIGVKCGPIPPGVPDGTAIDGDFDTNEFVFNGHIVGGWFNGVPTNGQGDAGSYPDLEVLFLQLSVPPGVTITGTISVFARINNEVVAFDDQEINCFEVGEVCDPPDCDDGNDCTDDECVGKVCVNTPIDCDDGDVCNGEETCDPEGGCQAGTPLDCDDDDECTDDDCDPASGCTHETVDCDDGDCCTDDDCDPASGCTHDPVDCPEGQSCNPDNCMCEEIPCETGEDCDDGNACTDDVCDGGVCSNPKINCPDDGNECTDTVCEPDTGCGHVNNNAPCEDGNDCTENDSCSGGSCQAGGPLDCDDGDECTDDGCEPAGGCTHEPTDCDDGDACTDDDCDPASGCTHETVDCDDGDCCTDDDCDPASGCTHDPVDCPEGQGCNPDSCMCEEIPCKSDKDCDDSNECTTDECTPNGCTNDPISCDDGDACTDDGCDPDSGCTNTPTDCDDGDACNGEETCDPAGGCQPGTPLDCNDDNDCTDDGCDPGSGCTNVPDDTNDCSDGDDCTEGDSCSDGECAGEPIDCPDGEVCVDGECVELGELELPLDIKPRMCPNTVMRDSNAAVWAALLGSDDFDITQVRMSGLLLSRADGVGGSLTPKNLKFKDEGTPFEGELCDCHAAGRDQITDLRMKFKTDAMVEAFLLNDEPSGSSLELIVTGQLNDGTAIFGRDCILLVR